MARSLNSQEVEIFNEAILAAKRLPVGPDLAEGLLKSDEANEFPVEACPWLWDQASGTRRG